MYVDTSVWVALVTRETTTQAVREFLSATAGVTYSEWCGTEVASALAMKVRKGELQVVTATQAWRDYRNAASVVGRELPIPRGAWRHAAQLCLEEPGRGLRAGDALHLAIASLTGQPGLATSDAVLAAAATAIGLEVSLLTRRPRTPLG